MVLALESTTVRRRRLVGGVLPLISFVLYRIVRLDRPRFRPPPLYGALFPHARSIQAWHPYVGGLLHRVPRHALLSDLQVSGVFEVTSLSIQKT